MIWWESFKSHPLTPNGLSVLRGVLGFTIPFFAFLQHPFWHILAAVIFIFAALTDYWDGYLARKHQGVSDAGKILDPTMDKFLILVPLAFFSAKGFFSPWWLFPIVFREIAVTFCRIGWMFEGKALGAEKLGKIKLVCQVALVGALLLYWICRDYSFLGGLGGFTFALFWILLPLTMILTVISGITFLYSNKDCFASSAFAKFCAACGVGFIPYAPGTMGSLLALFLLPLISWNPLVWIFTFIFLYWVGHSSVARIDLTRDKDPGFVVMDEVLGMMVTFAGVGLTPLSLLLGFLLFRFFDIVKPYPCRRFEKFPGFLGITADDLMAGVYARLVLAVIF